MTSMLAAKGELSGDSFDDAEARLTGLGNQCTTVNTNNSAALTNLTNACQSLSNCGNTELDGKDAICTSHKISFTLSTDAKTTDARVSVCASAKTQVAQFSGDYDKIVANTTNVDCDGIAKNANKYLRAAAGDGNGSGDNGEAD
jgi:hypothetical protein